MMIVFALLAQAVQPDVAGCQTPERQGERICLAKNPPQQISGVWINYFEGSIFIEGAQRVSDTRDRKNAPWFEIDDKTKVPRDFRREYGHAYRVTLLGWRAPNLEHMRMLLGYGHMGVFGKLVLADRILSMEDLGSADLPGGR